MFQSVRTGVSTVEEVPAPALTPGYVLVRNAASLVSAGTERMVIEFAEKNMLQKAKARPDLVRQVMDKARREGVLNTLDAVRSRLGQPLSLGYSSAGTVVGVGEGVTDIAVGDRVACSGMNYASHAEIVSVPRMLVTPIPSETVSFEDAAFTTVGAIALHGIRLAEVKLGETVAVIGLGLIGQLTVQMLKAAGCVVLGMDLDPERCRLAERNGCNATAPDGEEFGSLIESRTMGRGADAVIITAASASSEPVELAGSIARAKAIVVAVGAVGTEIPRKPYYEKELDFRISRSYGPGRYDPEYEEKGHDYPVSYVRWTESRNMEAFLHFVADGKISLQPLVTHRFPIEQATEAYDLITGKKNEPFMGVLIRYLDEIDERRRIDLIPETPGKTEEPVRVGVLGAGLFAGQVLLPAMQKAGGIEFAGVCTATGGTGKHAASRFGFRYCTTDEAEIFHDESINTVLVATRHHLHARQVIAALQAGKHVFCEKPLCLSIEELAEVVRAKSTASDQLLMVGYNRRFAPMAQELKRFLSDIRRPIAANYRINAGPIPAEHWTQDPAQGGGRILGEVCHFVDLLIFLTGSLPHAVFATALPASRNPQDSVVVNLAFEDGSIGTVSYIAEGDKAFGKERIEVFGGGHVAVLDDFRTLELVNGGRRTTSKSALRQDKGHVGEWQAFSRAVREAGHSPIPLREIFAGMRATIGITESLRSGAPVTLDNNFFAAPAT
ncbi:MAG TPA: bi-domain-containing oxidoreductase [Terriglobales bacterium]|nr:bi-domain-containing oxidoreductase [Terriglobales bacterium]